MANLILLNVSKRTVGSVGILNGGINTNNVFTYSPTQQFALDILNLATPIRSNPDGTTYFSTRNNASQQIDNRNVGITSWNCTDTLTTLASWSQDLIALTVVRRGIATINSEIMLFQTSKIIEVADIDGKTGYTRFEYTEDGEASLVTYEVTQTPAQLVTAGVSPVFNSDGYELYVNDIHGNDATAEFGNPLLPWATFDAAFAAAVTHATVANIIITGGTQTSTVNFAAHNINIEIKSDAILQFTTYSMTGVRNQIISGKGTLIANGQMLFVAAFAGVVTIDVGTFSAAAAHGVLNQSTANGLAHVTCDYSIMGTACNYLYAVTGTTNGGSFKTNIQHFDNTTGANRVNTFFINPSALVGGQKFFKFYIANGTSNSSNEGILCLSAIDGTYNIDAELNVVYLGNVGSPGLNAVLACISCTGGVVTLKGNQYIATNGKCAIILNSAVTVYDYSNTYHTTATTESILILAGGTSLYTYYGKKLATSTAAPAITVGATFLSASATTDFGTPTGTAGTDTLHFKGGLKNTYAANGAIGILVLTSPNLVIDGGTIEMTNSNTLNDAISSAAPENIKVFGTGFVRGAVNANITNVITGTNIIQDAGVVCVM